MTDRLRVRRVLAGVLAWALFAFCWVAALRRGVDGAFDGATVLALSSLAALVVTVAWQRHNKSVYRRKGPRQSRGLDRRRWTHDGHGHRLDFEDGLGAMSEVIVAVSADVKTYRAAP